ncbi:MlaD family protein [Sagittula sp. MA-2]|jgi:paraquat-inducible protein B|uniref:MlaD family protein n=1 Tax=Sagittula sp. MA-2 TaxID=3048007 RepID=UPI0024C428C1|nr:MlaD family protein [Sagittula sp. MA-2]WHZ37709.1 MlaD family protein [Sagittula sp. MA-2]
MTDQSSQTRDVPLSKPSRRPTSLSLIWLIPVIAILAALGVAWQNWNDRGPLIEVAFDQAAGVSPHETELRYRDIAVGVVEGVHFSAELDRVVTEIRLDKTIAPYVDTDSSFWIVRPEVTAQGVTGLDTVLSGVYIAGAWDGEPGTPEDRFVGVNDAPMLALGEEGVTFTLRSENGLPTDNTPILYRGVQVGRMGRTEVSDDGLTVTAQAVVLEPYTRLVTSSTRFWDISGFSFSINAQGASLDFSSLASLISGGVTFETLASGGTPLRDGVTFTLHPDEETAREDFFLEGEGGSITMMMIFEENLAGLSAGAPVTLGGLRIGEVESISGLVDAERFGDPQVRLATTIRINPGRIGLEEGVSEEGFLDYLETRVQEGLRGRLTNASLLTGGLKIDLVDLAEVAPAELDRDATPYPLLPTAPSDVANIAATAQGLLARVDALPVEEVMQEAIGLMGDLRGVVGSEEVQQVPESVLATLEAVRAFATSEEIAALPAQVGELAGGLTDASDKLNALLGDVQDQAVVAAVSELIASLDATAETLPALADQAGAVLSKAENLPLEDISARVTTLLDDADAILADPDLKALPADVRATLDGLRQVVTAEEFAALPAQVGELASGLTDASDKLNALLEEAQQERILASVSELIDNLGTTADKLPGIADQASAVLSDAEELSLDELAEQARALLESVDALVDQPSTRELPAQVNGTLAELRLALEELRQGGVVTNANATLAAARRAAEAISDASRSLPALADRLTVVANQAGVTISDYGRGSDFGREMSSALRQIEEAASSIDRLAKQIARNPNSLITGR